MPTDQSPEDRYHYGVIARALKTIDEAGGAPLALNDLAQRLSMSPAHFQRVFTRWVGISPKRYQQYLTLDHAKRLLAERRTLLDAADEAGLSGAGRLHDLFVRWEAMSPGEFARGADGLTVRWGWFESPFGPALVMGTDRGICGLAFAGEIGTEAAMADLRGRWPKARFVEDAMALRPWVMAAFGAGAEPAPVFAIGAPFQIKVWEALIAIPPGHVATYTDIARRAGYPQAVRAVGTAIGRNPVSWLIPCHRAIRKSGELGGYHWGLPVKRAMLAWESARAEAG
ncbi:MAG: methylated-DNA--[protein]-cysteine S-methyltransferase [Albidovulum sp.]